MINILKFFQKKSSQTKKYGLSDLVPTNLLEEKKKFFESNFTYNPQFKYKKIIPHSYLIKYGLPKEPYLSLAQNIVDNHIAKPKSPKKYLSQNQIEQKIAESLSQYDLEEKYRIVFSNEFVSRVAVNTKKQIIKLKLPLQITEDELNGIIAHEIETHLLRYENYTKQPWFRKRKKYGLSSDYIRTEEGLAVLHETMAKQNKSLFKTALNYLAVDLALQSDFVTVFNFFSKNFDQDYERAWSWTVKKKRGITDTSKPGAFTKDLVYFEGINQLIEWLEDNEYDLEKLYVGKISIDDMKKQIDHNTKTNLPSLFMENKNNYKKQIQNIKLKNDL